MFATGRVRGRGEKAGLYGRDGIRVRRHPRGYPPSQFLSFFRAHLEWLWIKDRRYIGAGEATLVHHANQVAYSQPSGTYYCTPLFCSRPHCTGLSWLSSSAADDNDAARTTLFRKLAILLP